jgi:hypothetical protein
MTERNTPGMELIFLALSEADALIERLYHLAEMLDVDTEDDDACFDLTSRFMSWFFEPCDEFQGQPPYKLMTWREALHALTISAFLGDSMPWAPDVERLPHVRSCPYCSADECSH